MINDAPNIVLTTDQQDNDGFKKPLFVSIKKSISRSTPAIATRQGRSRSEPSLFYVEAEENKENCGQNEGSSPTTTPTKFLKVSSINRNVTSPTNMPTMFANLSLTSPTKLEPPGRLFTEKQLEGTRAMHRAEAELLGRLPKAANQDFVDEALTQIRLTNSPRKQMVLPTMMNTSQPELNCLSSQTVADLVDGKYIKIFSRVIVLDCRFEYEYSGGHINGAVNVPKEQDLENLFIKCEEYHSLGEKLCLVFHCEFSSHRGPKAYKRLRAWDRKKHEQCYPKLIYPEMYLLEGGYKKFYEDCPDSCIPRGYVEMKDQYHVNECRLALMGGLGRSKSCRRFFSRSCTNITDEMSSTLNTSFTPIQKRNSPFAPSVKELPQTRDSPSVFERRKNYAKKEKGKEKEKEVEVEAENQNCQD